MLYACFKQAHEGDAPTQRPAAFDVVARAKFDAWSGLAGLGADDARRRYIALIEQLTSTHSA